MASLRVVSRLFVPKNLYRLSTNGQVRYFWPHHHHHQHRKNLPETYFGSMSNIFERWEKEFDRMQKQFNNFFQDLKTNRNNEIPSENDLIITESDGSKKFHLSLNIHGFEPEEIKIKTQNGTLTISGKKEKKMSNNCLFHEFSQTYTLPEQIKIDDLKSIYTENGILSIEAPILIPKDPPPKDRQVKIEHVK